MDTRVWQKSSSVLCESIFYVEFTTRSIVYFIIICKLVPYILYVSKIYVHISACIFPISLGGTWDLSLISHLGRHQSTSAQSPVSSRKPQSTSWLWGSFTPSFEICALLIFVSVQWYILKDILGTSLAVQWLRFHASTAGGMGLIPGWGTKILHAAWHSQKIKK